MAERSHAYNALWQVRADAWCRLEAAAAGLSSPTTPAKAKERYAAKAGDLLTRLTPVEFFWAYPGSSQFARLQRLFAAGQHDKFARTVTRINRALTTDSYRSGEFDVAGLDEQDMFPRSSPNSSSNPRPQGSNRISRCWSSRRCPKGRTARCARRCAAGGALDDEFVYELVVVSSGDEVVIAAQLNVNLQAVVVGRSFAARSTRDLSVFAPHVDTQVCDELADNESANACAQILASSLRLLRPRWICT